MRDLCASLKSSLEECGLEPTRVSVSRRYNGHGDTIIVTKELGDDTINFEVNLNDYETARQSQSTEQIMAMKAEKIARAFETHMVDEIMLGRRAMRVCPYDGGWAECRTCGERVELPEVDQEIGFERDAELCTPTPIPRDTKQFTEGLDDKERLMLKAYLLGLLREECDHECPNSRYYTEGIFADASD